MKIEVIDISPGDEVVLVRFGPDKSKPIRDENCIIWKDIIDENSISPLSN